MQWGCDIVSWGEKGGVTLFCCYSSTDAGAEDIAAPDSYQPPDRLRLQALIPNSIQNEQILQKMNVILKVPS